ncbi:DUF4198 domain-containing protein [Allorhizocola rhizosphaerae]|uniref:DUF4198 domain-containing protein n=1 Tax=Allorhizocola rhizosphaerae TaxID=1872709 RepID=UPI0013C2A1D2|nr:DUF4198 domain-containing protein [Allorhizocola rhizosphaerae]
MRTLLMIRAQEERAHLGRDGGRRRVEGLWRASLVVPLFFSAVVAVPATAAAADNGDVPGPSINAATMVSGVVTKNGQPVSGADVNAVAWPSTEVLAKLPAGAGFRQELVAQETTDAKGRFAISVDLGKLAKDYIGSNGAVDLTLIAADGQHQIRWNFTATKADKNAPGLWGNPRVSPALLAQRSVAGQAPTRLSIDIGDVAHVVEEGNEPEKWVGIDGQPLGPVKGIEAAKVTRGPRTMASKTADSFQPLDCTVWSPMDEYQYGRTESFVQAVGSGYAPPTVDQEVGTQHTLGVAYDGGNGSWHQSGSLTLSFGASAETTYSSGARIVYNKVNYRKYSFFCAWTWYYEWRPIGYYALNSGFGPSITPVWTSCTNYSSGTYTKNSGTNVVFSTGVNLTVANVSAQAQFSNNTKLKWTFSGPGKLCGSNSSGWVSAPQAGAYPQ